MSEPVAVLECVGLSARHGPLEVSWDVDLVIQAGEVVALLGPNGAGKTSTVDAIAGIVKSRGEVQVDGERIDALPAYRRARHGLAHIPEDRGLFGGLSVDDNLRLGAQAHRSAQAHGSAEDRIERVFELFPALESRRRQRASSLSGGEQQMLALGRAIAAQPRVLIVDEPTQGLAPKIYDVIVSALDAMRAEGMAVLLVEQNVDFASRIADRYLVMSAGRIVSSGGNRDLHQGEKLFAQFLAG